MTKKYSYEEALHLVELRSLPADFDQWSLCGYSTKTVSHEPTLPLGPNSQQDIIRTIAHVAALRNSLPACFDQWGLTDEKGWTVAHYAAWLEHLPEDFDQWELADTDGWTIAHAAAEYGRLPCSFDQWDMTDGNGITVADIAILNGHLTEDEYAGWKIRNALSGCDIHEPFQQML
jgi:hypothetical protein